jgi:hypothetical protein
LYWYGLPILILFFKHYKKGPHSFAKYFFPPNFSFVFCKRKIWREKIYSSKEWIYFAKEFLPLKNWQKNEEALESFMGIWFSRRNFPEFQMGLGFWCSDQLSAQPHNCRSNREKKTSTTLDSGIELRIELRTPKNPYIQSVL